MTRRVLEKLCTKKLALISWPLSKGENALEVTVSAVLFTPGSSSKCLSFETLVDL